MKVAVSSPHAYLAGALNTPTRVFQHQELDAVLRCKVHLDPPAAARAADRTMRGGDTKGEYGDTKGEYRDTKGEWSIETLKGSIETLKGSGDESSSQLPTRPYLAGALNTPTRD